MDDHSDKQVDGEDIISPVKVSEDKTESKTKRPREDNSEDDVAPDNKKARTDFEKEIISSKVPKNVEEKDKSPNDSEIISNNVENKNGDASPKDTVINGNSVKSKDEDEPESEQQSGISCVSLISDDEKEEKDEGSSEKKKITKCKSGDSEIVGGLELSVECASDKEESSSESADEKENKPRTKTKIVKAKPNDSEFDCSSSSEAEEFSKEHESEAEKEVEDEKETKKTNTENLEKTIEVKKTVASEKNSDNDASSNEENSSSPAKKKLPQTPREVKKGRGRPRKNVKKVDDEEKDVKKDENNKPISNDEGEESMKSLESDSSASEDDEEDGEAKADGKQRKRGSNKTAEDKRIVALKKYIRAAGITVKCYQELWAGCKSNAAKVKCLKEFLEKNGMSGRPTLEKCKKLKKKLQRDKEIAELDLTNIISEGRVTRSRRNTEVKKTTTTRETSETLPTNRNARNSMKRVRNVIESDSE